MTGTNKPNIMSAITNGGRASSVEEKLDNILERLTEIEKILNDPMHGIDMPEGIGMSINSEGIGFDGNYVDSAGNNLAFTTGYDVSNIDVKYDSLIDFDEGIQLNLDLDGDK